MLNIFERRILLLISLAAIVLLCQLFWLADSVALSAIKVQDTAGTLTTADALDYLDDMEKSHQQVLDHPEFLIEVDTNFTGDMSFHAECVKRYQELKKFVISMEVK